MAKQLQSLLEGSQTVLLSTGTSGSLSRDPKVIDTGLQTEGEAHVSLMRDFTARCCQAEPPD